MSVQTLLHKMWNEYIEMNPQAKAIHDLFVSEGEEVVNDHIALRTFNDPRVNIEVISQQFLQAGYLAKGEYEFTEKKLFAKHYEHPDSSLPKIFISELKLEKFDGELRSIVGSLLSQMSPEDTAVEDFCASGRPWEIDFKTYQKLQQKSEYAAWLSAWGYRPNHFTVSINKLKKYDDIRRLNEFIKKNSYQLNDSGGEIKGSPEVLLEQSSTLANNIEVSFFDGLHEIPGCYYEFAQRYSLEDGTLYQGFVAKSADKIFESTDKGQYRDPNVRCN